MFNDRYGLTDAVIEGRKTMTRRLIDPMPKDCASVHKNCWGAHWSDEPMSLVVDRDTGGIYCKYCGNGVRLYDGGYHYKTKYKVGDVVAVAQSYERIGLNPKHYIWLPDLDAFQLLSTVKGWRNKMYVRAGLMPHQIRITGIRCERLQDISDEDCMKEGVVGGIIVLCSRHTMQGLEQRIVCRYRGWQNLEIIPYSPPSLRRPDRQGFRPGYVESESVGRGLRI